MTAVSARGALQISLVQPPTWSRTVTKSALAFSSQLVEISKGGLSSTFLVAVSGLHYSLGETTFSSIQSRPPYLLLAASIPSLTVCSCQEQFGSVTFITPFKWLQTTLCQTEQGSPAQVLFPEPFSPADIPALPAICISMVQEVFIGQKKVYKKQMLSTVCKEENLKCKPWL